METRASYILVGAFIMSFMVAGLLAVVWLAGVDLEEESTRYDILFEGSVTGLKVGNPVRYRGIPVGIVSDMSINKQNVEQVRVTIEVPSSTPIKEDAVASLEFQGLTGVGYVQISGGTHNAPNLRQKPGERHPIIPSKASQLQEVFEQAPELINRFIALVDRANLILNPKNQENLASTLANVSQFTGTLNQSTGDLQVILKESADTLLQLRKTAEEAERLVSAFSEKSDDLAGLTVDTLTETRDFVTDARGFVQEARPVLETADDTMQDFGQLAEELRPHIAPVAAQTGDTMKELGTVAVELREAAKQIGIAAERIGTTATEAEGLLADNRDSVSHFTNTGLYEFSQLMSETRTLVSALTRISSELERDAARFLFGDTQKGFEAQ